jgi:hypothetical protein
MRILQWGSLLQGVALRVQHLVDDEGSRSVVGFPLVRDVQCVRVPLHKVAVPHRRSRADTKDARSRGAVGIRPCTIRRIVPHRR